MRRNDIERPAALAAGLKRYFTGIQCPRGHIAERFTSNGHCCVCLEVSKKEYRKSNPEKVRDQYRALRKKHAAKRNAYFKEYAKTHRELRAALERKRKATRLGAEGTHTHEDVGRIRSAQRDRCAYCCVNLKGGGHVDHIKALSKGGSNWPNNLQILCEPCNVSKHARDPVDFAQSKGFLL